MISCHALCYRQQKTMAMLASTPAERPVSFQLFGADPAMMADAAQIAAAFQPDMLDINMGCPVKKVTKKGAGAALMAQPDLAQQIISQVCQVSTLPVTVKIRAGVDRSTVTAVPFAQMVQDAGAAAVIVHGRTWSQQFSGQADWSVVASVKKALSIPVIGNGDIHSQTEASQKMAETGCDAIMIGRAALQNPLIFSPYERPYLLENQAWLAQRHLQLTLYYQKDTNFSSFKYRLGRYFHGFAHSAQLRKAIHACNDWAELADYLDRLRHQVQTQPAS